jgi:hypothetical protein
MVEQITTAIIIASSTLLFGYWLRCAFLLLRGQYPPSEAFSTPASEDILLTPPAPIQSTPGIS